MGVDVDLFSDFSRKLSAFHLFLEAAELLSAPDVRDLWWVLSAGRRRPEAHDVLCSLQTANDV